LSCDIIYIIYRCAAGTGTRSLRPPSYTSNTTGIPPVGAGTNSLLNHSGSAQNTLERGHNNSKQQNIHQININSNVLSSSGGINSSNSTNAASSSVLDKFKFFNSPPRTSKQGKYNIHRSESLYIQSPWGIE
jgi:hypothetical protein